MKINPSYIIASLMVVIIIFWFMMHAGEEGQNTAPSQAPVNAEKVIPTVVTQRISAQIHPNVFELYGRTEANREVATKAETAGLVISTPVSEGRFVKRGTVLCRQDIDARQARLDQAKAQLASAEFDLRSTETLVAKGYRSEIQLANLRAQVDGAKAGVKQAEIELDNVNIRAPFDGVFDNRMAETGDYLSPGQACGLLIDLDPIIVVADLSETQIGRINMDEAVNIELATGENVQGKIRFVESRSNPSTRTFRSEIEVPNPKKTLRAGVTATVRLSAGNTTAHQIPARVLALSDSGDVGVRYVDSNNIVRFAYTETIDETENGIWVTGLPDTVNLIIQGQDFVDIGTEVKMTNASNSSNSASVQ